MKRIALCLALLVGCTRTGFMDSNGETGVKDVDGHGGEVKAKGLLLDVPAGALDRTVRITIAPAAEGNPTDNVGAAFELGPDGTTFAKPVELTLSFDPAALPDPEHPELLRVAVAVNGEWEPLDDSVVDTTDKVVRASTPHFSRYGLIQICGNFRQCAAGSVCVRHRCLPLEVCGNGTDDDRDGLVDCADRDCANDAACTQRCCFDTIANQCVTSCCQNGACLGNCYCGTAWCTRCAGGGTETQCGDGVDNDGDGFVDCRDPDCASSATCAPAREVCSNGQDDDGDGLVDCADSDCAADPVACPSCCFVTIGQQCVPSCCQNGVCQGNCFCSPQLCTMCQPATPEVCNDGTDNDRDGLVDCADPDCASSTHCAPPSAETLCSDGIDNDRDGLADCRDTDCQSTSACTCTGACCFPKCAANEELECLGANICGYPCSCKPKPNRWFLTCGDPVCRGHTITGVRACTAAELAGAACPTNGDQCDPSDGCNALLRCDTTDPRMGSCPISRAKFKDDIHVVEQGELERYHAELMSLPLATWKYKQGDERTHLGFMIDGNEGLICVQPDRDQIDVYGYTSMAVAALKVQQAQIEALQAQVKALEARLTKRR